MKYVKLDQNGEDFSEKRDKNRNVNCYSYQGRDRLLWNSGAYCDDNDQSARQRQSVLFICLQWRNGCHECRHRNNISYYLKAATCRVKLPQNHLFGQFQFQDVLFSTMSKRVQLWFSFFYFILWFTDSSVFDSRLTQPLQHNPKNINKMLSLF